MYQNKENFKIIKTDAQHENASVQHENIIVALCIEGVRPTLSHKIILVPKQREFQKPLKHAVGARKRKGERRLVSY